MAPEQPTGTMALVDPAAISGVPSALKVTQYPTRRAKRPVFPKAASAPGDGTNRRARRANDARMRSVGFVRQINADNRRRARALADAATERKAA